MPTDLKVQTFDGVPRGSNTDSEPHEIPDGFARNIIDAWVDSPGLIRQRGPVTPYLSSLLNTFNANSDPLAIFQTNDPLGNTSIAVMYSYTSNTKIKFFNSVGTEGLTEYSFPTVISGGSNTLVSTSPLIGGGVVIGLKLNNYNPNGLGEWLFYWKGGRNGETFVTGTSYTRGSTTVSTSSGSFANLTPGMFLRGSTTENTFTPLIGVVRNITDSTHLELESPALHSIGSDTTGIFTPIRGLGSRSSTGRITIAAGATTVVGSDTKFVSQDFSPSAPPAALYHLYRKRDLKFIGKVNGVTNETTLSLVAASPAGSDMVDDEYVAIDHNTYHTLTTYDDNFPGVGCITATYADRQWYANFGRTQSKQNLYSTRLWFSEQDDAEALDLSPDDGNFINIDSKNNDPVVGMFAMKSALLIFTHNEVFALTGTNPNQFRVSRLSDDGALGGMAIIDFHGGVVWAGRRGVYIYDGIKYQNLLNGRYTHAWLDAYATSAPTNMVVSRIKDTIIVQARGIGLRQTIVKGKDTETHVCALVLDVPTGSIVFFTNCAFFGSVNWQNHNYALVKNFSDGKVNLVNLDTLFAQTVSGASTGIDEIKILDTLDTLGPRFFVETSRYSMGQLLQLKTWKRLIVQYFSTGNLKCDLVPGIIPLWPAAKTLDLPDTGYTWDSLSETFETWDDVAVFNLTWDQLAAGTALVKRKKFLLRSQLCGLRFYTEEPVENSVQIASWALGFKWMRPGRV